MLNKIFGLTWHNSLVQYFIDRVFSLIRDILFGSVYDRFSSNPVAKGTFLECLEPYILNDDLVSITPSVMKDFVDHYEEKEMVQNVEACIVHMDIASIDIHQVWHPSVMCSVTPVWCVLSPQCGVFCHPSVMCSVTPVLWHPSVMSYDTPVWCVMMPQCDVFCHPSVIWSFRVMYGGGFLTYRPLICGLFCDLCFA